MTQPLSFLKETASQTAGPYVHIGLMPNHSGITGVYPADLGTVMVQPAARGTRIRLTGRVLDGTGTPLRDCLVEIWQADASGLYNSPEEKRRQADPAFTGWGRSATDNDEGRFCFDTLKPGPVPYKDGRPMAPHITLWIVARGINLGLHTRAYFADETAAKDADPVLQRIEHRHRVQTLMAQPVEGGYHFDIHLQGERETVFFDI